MKARSALIMTSVKWNRPTTDEKALKTLKLDAAQPNSIYTFNAFTLKRALLMRSSITGPKRTANMTTKTTVGL